MRCSDPSDEEGRELSTERSENRSSSCSLRRFSQSVEHQRARRSRVTYRKCFLISPPSFLLIHRFIFVHLLRNRASPTSADTFSRQAANGSASEPFTQVHITSSFSSSILAPAHNLPCDTNSPRHLVLKEERCERVGRRGECRGRRGE